MKYIKHFEGFDDDEDDFDDDFIEDTGSEWHKSNNEDIEKVVMVPVSQFIFLQTYSCSVLI